MSTDAFNWPQPHTKHQEPYPFKGHVLQNGELGYLAGTGREGEDLTLFGYRCEETGEVGLMELLPNGNASIREMPAITADYMGRLNSDPITITPAQPSAPLSDTSPLMYTARAVATRHAVIAGNGYAVESFTSQVLGLWHGAGWCESVSTALLGDWADSLHHDGIVTPLALDRLKEEVRAIHKQLTPIWQRRINGERLWSLDLVFADGMTTYDLVAGGPDPYETLFGALPDDPRINAVLSCLTREERAVVLTWSRSGTTTWTQAAADVINLAPLEFAGYAPAALGERVRRKLKRLGEYHVIGSNCKEE